MKSQSAISLRLLIGVLCASVIAYEDPVAQEIETRPLNWKQAAPMAVPRATFTATLLNDGEVLVTGGFNGQYIGACEIYAPQKDTWRTVQPMRHARYGHTASQLNDGRVLIVGGFNGQNLPGCELYDPKTGNWTDASPLHTKRDRHTATLLPDGHVLVAGGFNSGQVLADVEVYDPQRNEWSTLPPMPTPRAYHTATPLDSTRIFFALGESEINLETADFFDPANNAWSPAPSFSIPHAFGQTATKLRDGRVLIVGGEGNARPESEPTIDLTEIFDPRNSMVYPTGHTRIPRDWHTATLMKDGKVIVTGGYQKNRRGIATRETEIFDPTKNSWSDGPPIQGRRGQHTSVLLQDGTLLAIGGRNAGKYLATCERLSVGAGF